MKLTESKGDDSVEFGVLDDMCTLFRYNWMGQDSIWVKVPESTTEAGTNYNAVRVGNQGERNLDHFPSHLGVTPIEIEEIKFRSLR